MICTKVEKVYSWSVELTVSGELHKKTAGTENHLERASQQHGAVQQTA